MLPTQITHHRWVRYTVEGGDVIVDPATGEPHFVERAGRSVGEQIGCAICDEPLSPASAVVPCLGSSEC